MTKVSLTNPTKTKCNGVGKILKTSEDNLLILVFFSMYRKLKVLNEIKFYIVWHISKTNRIIIELQLHRIKIGLDKFVSQYISSN